MKHTQYQCSTATQQKVIDAVIGLVHQKNFETITVQDICRAAGVSTGSFYHQFGTKDGVVMAAYQTVDRLLTDGFMAENRLLPPIQALDHLLRRYILYVQQEVGVVIAQYYRVLLNHPAAQRYDANRPFCREIRSILSQAQAQGLVDTECDLTVLSESIMRLLRGLLFDWVIQGEDSDLLTKYRLEFEIFLRGVRPQGPGQTPPGP